jgi:hypothetical protein
MVWVKLRGSTADAFKVKVDEGADLLCPRMLLHEAVGRLHSKIQTQSGRRRQGGSRRQQQKHEEEKKPHQKHQEQQHQEQQEQEQ